MSTPDSPLRDRRARARIGPWHPKRPLPPLDGFEPETNFVVRAAAGSGKTTALIGRMVALVRTGVPVEEVVAITFTRKAAGEMQERFYEELHRAKAAASGEEKRRLGRALEQMPRCFIGTIHAFCARLLRERPEAAGLPQDFKAGIEARDEEELRRRIWRRYLQRAWEERREETERLVAAGVELGDLEHFFGRLCLFPDLEPYIDGEEEPPAMEEALGAAHAFLEAWLPEVPTEPPEKGPDAAMKALLEARDMREHVPLEASAEQVAFLELFDRLMKPGGEKGKVTLSRWPDRERAYALRDEAIPELIATLRPALEAWRAHVHGLIARFACPAVEAFRRVRYSRGLLTFGDLLHATARLLRERPDVRRAFQARYRYVLVDEFQDTDPVQAEILFYLTGRKHEETNWAECDPAPGRLFIVGDDKQSIYGFRRADMGVFNTVRRLIAEQPHGDAVDLVTNFRSVPGICRWCDDAFGPLFEADGAAGEQAEYVPFAPFQKGLEGGGPAVRQLRVAKVDRHKAERIARQNADQIACFIRGACERPGPLVTGADGEVLAEGTPGDFMILTRNTTRLAIYAEALARHGVRYIVAGGKDARDSDELRGLVDLLAATYRPDDPVARVAYLRGPLVGLSDDELYRLRQAGVRYDRAWLPKDALARVDDELAARAGGAYAALEGARRLLATMRPAAALTRLVAEEGLVARSLQEGRLGSLRAGRLLRILSEVRHLDAEGRSGIEIWKELERILHGEVEVDGLTLETGAPDCVRLMNVHKAKGLQASVVFLADPYHSRHPRPPEDYVQRERGAYVRPVFRHGRFRRTMIYGPRAWRGRFEEAAARAQAAEEHRLQYVAATRAKHLLVVSRYEGNEKKGFWAPLYAALDAAGAPDLAAPPAKDEKEAPALPAPDLTVRHAQREARLEAACAPAYAMRTVTGGEKPSELVGTAEAGYGRSFGTAVHELFELLIRERARMEGLDKALIARVVAAHAGGEELEDQLGRAERMLERWRASALWRSVQGADRVMTEVPVAARLEGEPPTLVRGVVDLLFREGDRWTLVDFKTDRIEDGAALEKLAEHYAPQVQAYAAHWQRAAGVEVGEAGLWFADAAAWRPVAGPKQKALVR